ncbi:MAG: holin family protein [Rhodobacteraceae bacterium]|nr:holin family protein [Paracoccaceae bacterium]
MGLMGRVLGVGGAAKSMGAAVTGVAEVFVGNRAAREAAASAQLTTALGQYGAEFASVRASRFDGFMNGLNRLPRPLLVGGTLGLFVYAMFAPAGFSVRMQGLALVPEPLWWLLGAIVSFYFGARELHYRREGALPAIPIVMAARSVTQAEVAAVADPAASGQTFDAAAAPDADLEPDPAPAAFFGRPAPRPAPPLAVAARAADPQFNAALEEWRQLRA